MRFFVASHILSIFWAWHCSKCIEKSNRTILCSQHAQKRESTNSLMPYYGLNIKVIVHSHKYQPVRGHWFFLMHLKLLCLHLCIIAHWLADKMTWHKSRLHNTLLVSCSEYPRDKAISTDTSFEIKMIVKIYAIEILFKSNEPFQSYLLNGQANSAKSWLGLVS